VSAGVIVCVDRSHQDHFDHSDPLQPVAYFVLDDDWFVILVTICLFLHVYKWKLRKLDTDNGNVRSSTKIS